MGSGTTAPDVGMYDYDAGDILLVGSLQNKVPVLALYRTHTVWIAPVALEFHVRMWSGRLLLV